MSNAIVYEELKEKARTMPMVGIFYAFDNEQFVKGCIECGYTMDYKDALKAARHYFPKYKPSKKLVEQLMYGECR